MRASTWASGPRDFAPVAILMDDGPYIVGVHPDDLPAMPPPGVATGLVKPRRDAPRDGRKIITKAAREHTPEQFGRSGCTRYSGRGARRPGARVLQGLGSCLKLQVRLVGVKLDGFGQKSSLLRARVGVEPP